MLRVARSTSFTTPIAVIATEQVENMVEQVRLEKALEQQPAEQGMMQI